MGVTARERTGGTFWRWAVVTVPLVILIGFTSGRSAPSGSDNPWYVALAKPALNPPDWMFPIAWGLIYVCMGLALATVLDARGASRRWPAVGLFALLMALLFAWQPLFFGARAITAATWLIGGIVAVGIATTVLFGRIRRSAAWLMLPLLVWSGFAGVLSWRIDRLNPGAEAVAPEPAGSQMA